MNAPPWRVWLTVFLVCGWGIGVIRAIQKNDPAIAVMCAALFAVNAYTLWLMTRQNK